MQYVVASLLAAQAIAFDLRQFPAGHVLFIVSHAIVIAVAARCFLRRQHSPPETFVLVGLGMLSGLIAGLVNAGIALGAIPQEWDVTGRRLMTEGMVLLLVLGIGGFLGPRLLGFAQLPNFEAMGASTARRPLYAVAGVVLLASIALEYHWGVAFVVWLRAAIITVFLFVNVQPYRPPATRTTLAWCVWLAFWLLIAAAWSMAAFPEYRIDVLHVMFMGGFTLLILAVGTRVVLSHGGYSLDEERRSWPLRLGLITVLVAMASRLAAAFVRDSYFGHLAWAAVFWLIGMLIWGVFIARRIRSA